MQGNLTPKEQLLYAYDQIILKRIMDANKEQNVDQEEMDFYAREAGNAFLNYLDPQGNPINPDLEIKILRLFGECIEAIEELKILKKGK